MDLCLKLSDVASFVAILISVWAIIATKRQHIVERRPYLIFSEEQFIEDGQVYTGFYVRNIGKGTALNLEIPQKCIDKYDFLKSFQEIPRNISAEGVTLFFRRPGNNRIISQDVRLEITYEDIEARKYKTVLDQMKHTVKKIR